MKRKFIILTLCFTIIFSSLNFKKSYADGGVISLPMLATVSALAVGTGIVINSNDDLYDIGRLFYEYVDKHNDFTWQTVQTVFLSAVTLVGNKVNVDSKFLDIVKDFFDNTFSVDTSISQVGLVGNLPYYGDYKFNDSLIGYKFPIDELVINGPAMPLGDFLISYGGVNSYNELWFTIRASNSSDIYIDSPYSFIHRDIIDRKECYFYISDYNETYKYALNLISIDTGKLYHTLLTPFNISSSTVSFPYNGEYTWDNVESKKENESVALPIPGDLGQLVGQGSSDFWDNTDNLVGSGNISIPNINNPSINLDNTTSFPNTNVDTNNPSIPDVNNPTVEGILPAFPSFGDSLDFSPMYLTNVTEKFPFSLPWDIGRLISKFDVDPVAPFFEVPIVSETITLDLTEFSELASIVRFFVLIGFILALIFISTKLMA